MFEKLLNPMVVLPIAMAMIIALEVVPGSLETNVRIVIVPLLFLITVAAIVWHLVRTVKRAGEGIRKIGTTEEGRIFGFRKWKVWTSAVVVLTLIAFAGGEILTRRMPMYQQAMRDLRQSQEAFETLGGDLKAGWLASSSEQTAADGGHLDLDVSVAGNRGKGHLYLTADELRGVWSIKELYVIEKRTGARIEIVH